MKRKKQVKGISRNKKIWRNKQKNIWRKKSWRNNNKKTQRTIIKIISSLLITGIILFIIFLLITLLKNPYPDIKEWHTCETSEECVPSSNIMCAEPYKNINDACINKKYLNKSLKIPKGSYCKYGITECECIDNKCYASK